MKEFFLAGYINEENYKLLFSMIDDRNRLSHIYNKVEFDEIYVKLKDYFFKIKDNIKKYGILFLGRIDNDRYEILKNLKNYDLKIFGFGNAKDLSDKMISKKILS